MVIEKDKYKIHLRIKGLSLVLILSGFRFVTRNNFKSVFDVNLKLLCFDYVLEY